MTRQKDFKRLVRGRMQKTGESYTAARAAFLGQSATRNAQRVDHDAIGENNGNGPLAELNLATSAETRAPDLAQRAGMSDEKVKAATGCTWESWVWALDQVHAYNWPHPEIARYVHEKYKVPSWWTQTVTVGYERIRGLREKGQRRSGAWGASKSKTIDAAAGTIFRSFKQPKLRSAWLSNEVAIRTSVPNKSLRMTWEDGTSVEVNLVPKARSKTQVVIEHTRLTSRQESERMKAFWAAQLESLANRVSRQNA